ncbi:hypothetical protein DFS34DRAFT_136027 [Phlyctochytrium arcticum]|nr:hypothetical protein DFS34DRAFT_136027 [Phlyctochytrium arcticum]
MAAVCVFTNGLDNVVYKKIFAMVDALCKEETGCRLRFRYVDGEETSIKVMTGPFFRSKRLGQSYQLSWKDYVLNVFKSCKVHFTRTVNEYASLGPISKGLCAQMLNIQYCDEPVSMPFLIPLLLLLRILVSTYLRGSGTINSEWCRARSIPHSPKFQDTFGGPPVTIRTQLKPCILILPQRKILDTFAMHQISTRV